MPLFSLPGTDISPNPVFHEQHEQKGLKLGSFFKGLLFPLLYCLKERQEDRQNQPEKKTRKQRKEKQRLKKQRILDTNQNKIINILRETHTILAKKDYYQRQHDIIIDDDALALSTQHFLFNTASAEYKDVLSVNLNLVSRTAYVTIEIENESMDFPCNYDFCELWFNLLNDLKKNKDDYKDPTKNEFIERIKLLNLQPEK